MSTPREQSSADETALRKLAEALKGLRYGAVTVTVHNGRIVQIDRVERTRFDRDTLEPGEGI